MSGDSTGPADVDTARRTTLANLMKKRMILDGEVVVLNEKGVSDFSQLQNWRSEADGDLFFYVFDILWFNGRNVLDVPLFQRRKILKLALGKSDIVRFSDHVDEKGIELFELVEKHEVEGIVAKHKESIYSPGYRTNQWLKIKTGKQVEAFVAGFGNAFGDRL